jgi:hypothetical protein
MATLCFDALNAVLMTNKINLSSEGQETWKMNV